MGLLQEFRDFAVKGNAMDLAIGVIIGAAFGKIVDSIVKDLIMPPIGILGNADFNNLFIPLTSTGFEAWKAAGYSGALEEAKKLGPVLAYGSFLTILINFLILAFCVFMLVKFLNKLKKAPPAPAGPPPAPPEDIVLLREIRDSLKR